MIYKILTTNFAKYFIGFLYTIVFYIGYIFFLNKYFDYFGYGITGERINNVAFLIVTLFFSIFPLRFFMGVNKISSFLCVFIYYILYVPIVVTYYFNFAGTVLHTIYIQALFMIGMILLFSADRFDTGRKIVFKSKIDPFKATLIFSFISIMILVFTYRSNLKFVGLKDIYTQRFANAEFGENALIRYISSWLANLMVPICLTYGLFSKKKLYFIFGAVGSVIIYMAIAAKSVILYPPIIFLLFKIIKQQRLRLAFSIIGLGLIVLLSVTLLLPLNPINSVLWMRTVGIGGLLTKAYHEFFLENPYTYYSHINIVNFITQNYPYGDKGLGLVIGSGYWGSNMNANANFWATDGIAAVGEIGILVASFILFCLFIVFNKISKTYNQVFVILVLVPYIFSLLNGSLFSSLLTGGAFFLFILLAFEKAAKNKYII